MAQFRSVSFLICSIQLLFLSASGVASTRNPTALVVTVDENLGPTLIQGPGISIRSEWTDPQIEEIPSPMNWNFVRRRENFLELGGVPGRATEDTYETASVRLIRQSWSSESGDAVGFRVRVENCGDKVWHLQALYPLRCVGAENFGYAGTVDLARWDVLLQKRLKNDVPGLLGPEREEEVIDPFCLFHGRQRDVPSLLVGYLSQWGHLARILLKQDRSSGALTQFAAQCELDGCEVPPGDSRTSQWLYLQVGQVPQNLIRDYADRMGLYHGVRYAPGPAPSVWFSWYYHQMNYSEKLFLEDIEELRRHHLPFDVFMIDACWARSWGEWEPNEKWPRGMKWVADQIKEAGYTPGIWTAPFLVSAASRVAQDHPEWLATNRAGRRLKAIEDHWVLDPTHPGAREYLYELYHQMYHNWGYRYFKLDFVRAVILDPEIRFYDRSATRLEAYREGLQRIREAIGKDTYLSICGGHYGGSLGIGDGQRSGSDVNSIWNQKMERGLIQNRYRTWMGRLWHIDPDALMLRRNDQPVYPGKRGAISLGTLTDDEALIFTLKQYVGGAMIGLGEYFPVLDADRLALWRHVIPSINVPSVPLDLFNRPYPFMMLKRIKPRCRDLGEWVTVSVINSTLEPLSPKVSLSGLVTETISADHYLVFEFHSQRILGLYESGQIVEMGELPPHTSRLLKIIPWARKEPVLVGTDLHFSAGGVEISGWEVIGSSVRGEIDTRWDYPVKITVAKPSSISPAGFVSQVVKVYPGQSRFFVDW